MNIIFFFIFIAFIVVAILLRFRWSFGKMSFKELVSYVKSTSPDTLASFICSHQTTGNVGLFFNKESINCSNSDKTVFDIKPADLKRVEYSDRNFFRFITESHNYKISYLHEIKEGENFANNLLLTPNLSYTDPGATQKLISVLNKLDIEYIKRPHFKVLFFPFQGSPAVLGFMILIVFTFFVYVFLSK